MSKLALPLVASLLVAACSDRPTLVAPVSAPTSPRPSSAAAPAAPGAPIAGRYIVVFRDGTDVDRESSRIAAAFGGRVTHTYHAALRGMAIEIPDAAASALANVPSVALVEQDQEMSAVTTQSGATWGLDRIDQRALPLSDSYTYGPTGAGVTVYIIDTGIWFAHTEFAGRAVTGVDEITSGGTATDCNGHGTHVSGTIGGATYGVAKSVTLVAVRVLGCNGSGANSGVIAGVDWVTANHKTPAAANMSLGGSLSSALDQAVANSIASGVTYGIAAGNGNFLGFAQDACKSSPADVASAITVSATDKTDTKASWANYGTCVDIFAPGVDITSSWYTSNTATNTISGTSMATPHVVGAAALYLEANPSATPAQVAAALTSNATAGVVKSPGSGSPNELLFTGFIGGSTTPTPPVARFTSSCSGLTCSFDASTSTTTGTVSYAWTFGDGAASTVATTGTSHTYTTATTYTVALTVTDANGTSAPATQTVTVAAAAAPSVSFTTACAGRTCTFDASATANATTYAWSFGDGTTGSGVNPSHTFPPNGTFAVQLTASGAGGSNSTTTTVTCAKKLCS